MIFDLIRGGDFKQILIQLLISIPVFLLSLSFHEFGHAWVANKCGDPTARLMGRCTLDPRRHIDPTGLVMLLLIGIGYAKPVPVNPRNFKHPRRDDILVSVAGVTCNLILALIAAALLIGYLCAIHVWGNPILAHDWVQTFFSMITRLFTLNIVLAIFNLLPVPPLDGYHLFNDILFKGRLYPPQIASQIGMGLLMILSFTGILGKGLGFVVDGAWYGLQTVAIWALQMIGGM